jgi:hypothetical protein
MFVWIWADLDRAAIGSDDTHVDILADGLDDLDCCRADLNAVADD